MFDDAERDTIPDEIKSKIPDYFYIAFGGELVSLFGLDIFDPIDERDEINEAALCGLDFLEGTSGWSAALWMTCKKLDMDWLWDYWDSLEWYDSDMFDGEIGDKVIEVMRENYDNPGKGANCYYKYIISRKRS